MNDSRQKILNQIRSSLHRGELTVTEKNELAKRFALHPRGILPHLTEDPVTYFIQQAKKSLAEVERIHSSAEIPPFLLTLLPRPISLRIASNKELDFIPWENFSEITLQKGPALSSDKIALTSSLCGIAETGTLVLTSSKESPTTLNFLPEIQVVLLSEENIVAHYEDAWDKIREKTIHSRTINFITGPSRTGDIEQTMQIGVHGPKKVYILLYVEKYLCP